MPNLPLPSTDFLGDGQRTTAEFQDAIDQVQNWLIVAQAELDALSDTTFGEAAVRGVGSLTGDVPDKAVLDTRLGTIGNLSGLGEFDPRSPTLVWTGSSNLVNYADITGGDQSGLYIFEFSPPSTSSTFVGSVYRYAGNLQREIIYFKSDDIVSFPDFVFVHADFTSTQVIFTATTRDGTDNTVSSQAVTRIWRV